MHALTTGRHHGGTLFRNGYGAIPFTSKGIFKLGPRPKTYQVAGSIMPRYPINTAINPHWISPNLPFIKLAPLHNYLPLSSSIQSSALFAVDLDITEQTLLSQVWSRFFWKKGTSAAMQPSLDMNLPLPTGRTGSQFSHQKYQSMYRDYEVGIQRNIEANEVHVLLSEHSIDALKSTLLDIRRLLNKSSKEYSERFLMLSGSNVPDTELDIASLAYDTAFDTILRSVLDFRDCGAL